MDNIRTVEFNYKNECLLCNKVMKMKKMTLNSEGNVDVEFYLYHPDCRRLLKKREKIFKNLKECDYAIFKKYIEDENEI